MGRSPLAVRRGPGEPLWNGSPGAPLPSFAAQRKKVAPAGAKQPSSCLRPRRSGQNPRLPSKGGGSNGGGAPLAVRRGPGDLYGMVPRRVFSPFLRDEKWGRPQAKRSRPNSRPRRSGQSSGSLRIRRSPLLIAPSSRRLRRASFFAAKERGERNRLRGPISRRSP